MNNFVTGVVILSFVFALIFGLVESVFIRLGWEVRDAVLVDAVISAIAVMYYTERKQK